MVGSSSCTPCADERRQFGFAHENRPATAVKRESLAVKCAEGIGSEVYDLFGIAQPEKVEVLAIVQGDLGACI